MVEELRRYEMYVVFQPELDDEGLEGRIERVNGFLATNGGEIIEVVRKGKRRLVYPINRFNQGIDVIYQLYLPSRRLETMERQLNMFEDVLRYLILRRDDLEKASRVAQSAEQVALEVATLQALPTEVDGREGTELGNGTGLGASVYSSAPQPTFDAPQPTFDETAAQPVAEDGPSVSTDEAVAPVTEGEQG